MWYGFLKSAGKKDVLNVLNNNVALYKYIDLLEPKFQLPAAYFLINGIKPEQVKDYFQNRSVLPGDSVIFDIDETVLSNVNLSIEENFETKRGTDTNYLFRSQARCSECRPRA
mgnify:CR=1 FL=1